MKPYPLQARLREAIAAVTGHRPEDLEPEMFLESDLGIDSIKMVELSQNLLLIVPDALRDRFAASVPTERLMQAQTLHDLDTLFDGWDDGAAAAPAPGSGTVAPTANGVPPAPQATPAQALSWVQDVVARVTGHEPAQLEAGLFLESELGIDSIKMVELGQALQAGLPGGVREAFGQAVAADRLMQLQTIGDIAALLAPWLQGDPLAAAATTTTTTTTIEPAPAPPPAQVAPQRVEILPAQYAFLVGHYAISTCSLASRLRVRGPLDPERARRTWTELLRRHPALRSRFVVPPGCTSFAQYTLEVAPPAEAPPLEWVDLSGLDPARRDAAVAADLEACVNRGWALDAPLLHRWRVLRLEDRLHELVFTNHHLISDGLGNQQLMREFVALHESLETGRPADVVPATSVERYAEIAGALGRSEDAGAARALAALLRRQGKQSFTWSPSGRPKADRQARVAHHRLALDTGATRALVRMTAELRVTLNALLVGAYLRTIAALGGSPAGPVFVNVPTGGRLYPGVDATGVVGCFAQNLALDFAPPAAGERWDALVRRVHERLDEAIAGGADRAQTAQAAQAIRERVRLVDGVLPAAQASLVRAGMKSNLYLPYIGNTHLAERYGSLAVEDYQAATTTNPGTIDTVVELFRGELAMTANYDADFLDAALVRRFAETFIAQLRDLAAQPAAARTTPHTAAAAGPARDQVRQVAEEVMHRAVADGDLALDLEADLGLDSLERVRIVARLERLASGADRRRLMACRSLAEMAAALAGPAAAPAAAAEAAADGLPYLRIVEQCRRTPAAVAVLGETESLHYGELDRLSNQLAHRLRAQGVGPGRRVGLMLHRGPRLLVALLGILKAGGAYVPLDPDYPAARLSYIVDHARLSTLVTENAVQAALEALLPGAPALRHLVYVDEGPAAPPAGREACGRADWTREPATDLMPEVRPEDPMVVLYTSGSSGRPKGVLLNHRGYANRLAWHQQLFRLQAGERVALKTSVCFDISVWELLWPLQHGGTICPVDGATLRDPWALAQWVATRGVHVMHFVPSLFGEFVNAVESQPIAFPQLRQLVFSGEALPAPLVRRWFARFGLGAALANLYGPTEASIDVSAWQMTQMPEMSLARIPIGHAMPGVQLLVLDEHMRRVPAGEQGELWIGGVQLADGYLHDPERTAAAFRPNPFAELPCPVLYRTGDLCVQLPDGSFDYRGRCDSQVKIRGYRVELGEIEVALASHPAVLESAVLAVDPGDGHLRLEAWLALRSGQAQPEVRALREFLGARLPAYMVPARYEWLAALPKNPNGKLDRGALSSRPRGGGEGAEQARAERLVENRLEFRLAPAQQWLLKYFDAPWQWAGYSRFRYLQALDIGVFNRALQRLARRHAALRAVFQQRGEAWTQRFPVDAEGPQAEVYDGSHLDAATREQHLRTLIAERVAALRLDSGRPLWHVIVIKEADERWDLCVVGHHIVCDMIGNGTLFRSLWQLYGEGLAGQEVDEAAGTPCFIAYLEALEKLHTREQVARAVDFWSSRFPAAEPPFAVPMDRPDGRNVEASQAVLGFDLGPDCTAALQRARARHGCNLYTLLLAPMYRAMAEWSGRDRVTLSHRSHGRDLGDGSTWFDCVGDFAVNFPVVVDTGAAAGWAPLVQAIRREFEALPLNGVSYDLFAERLPPQAYPDERLTPVRVNYLGHRSLPQSPLFEFEREGWDQRYALPEQKRTALIEAFFVAADGTMRLELSYSQAFHDEATMRRLGERYRALLSALLADAGQQPAAPTPTPLAAAPAPAAAAAAPIAAAPALPGLPAPVAQWVAGARPSAAPAGPLAGKVAVVTGAGRGIGRSIAARLAAQGATLVLVSRSAAPLDEALAEVRAQGGEAVAIAADVTSAEAVEELFRQVAARFGGTDILVNNAGANRSLVLAESDPKQWREIVDLNLTATYLCCRSAVPQMAARGGGKIVNLGSAASVIGYPLFSAYCAAKHAVVGLTKSLAEEVKHANVQVNVVCPAFVDTRMTPQAFRGLAMPAEQVADVVLFLASPASAAVTGESINIFGRQDMYAYGSEKMNLVKAMTREFRPGVSA